MARRSKRSSRQSERTAGSGNVLDRLTPRPGAPDSGFAQFEEKLRRVLVDPQQAAQLMAEVARLPSAAELTPPQLHKELAQVEREATKALGMLGVTVDEVRDRVGIGYSGGHLGVYDRTTTPKRKPLPTTVRLFAVALELAWQGRLWLDHGLVNDATRACLDARTLLAVAPQAAGRAKGGKRRAEQRPTQTRTRNDEMRKDYLVARLHDGLEMSAATKYVAKKYALTVATVRRAIKPRAREREMRRS